MRCKTAGELYDVIGRIAPFSTQCEWDNSGLLVGSADSKVNRIGVVLDITVEAIEKARSLGIDMIVAHHPVIFRPISNIPVDSPAYLLVKYGMTAVCSHTPLDKSIGGVNDALASKLGFTDAAPLFSGMRRWSEPPRYPRRTPYRSQNTPLRGSVRPLHLPTAATE